MIADDYDGDLLLFVIGIPSKAYQEKLINCLAEYGIFRIVSLKTSKSGNKIIEANPQSNMRRGFCIAQAFDLISFSNLIAANRIDFEGRYLGVTKFRQ